jgi:multidrug efflux system outer membrane protein
MHRPIALISLACLGGMLCGCGGLGSEPVAEVKINAPAAWKETSSGSQRLAATGWLKTFDDPALEAFVAEAIARNQDLAVAAARLNVARAAAEIGKSARLPSLTAGLASRETVVEDGSGSSFSPSYDLALSASWEPDLWGRLRDLERASFADYQAALADFRGARLSLAANTSKAWYNLLTAGEQVALAKETLDSFERNLRVVERSFRGGVPGVSALDVQLARTNVSAAQRSLANTTLNRDEAARTLEIFLSRYPAAEINSTRTLPALHGSVPGGLPAAMVERRPDLAAARARVLASAGRATAAEKSLLPNLRLTGSGGTANGSLASLLDRNLLTAAVNASLFQILTDGGRTQAEARAAVETNRARVAEYVQACLVAFREVESALAAERSLRTQEGFLLREVQQAALAEVQANRAYSEGVDADILRVLESQRRANNARASQIRLRNDLLQNRIDLFLALGGDFATATP